MNNLRRPALLTGLVASLALLAAVLTSLMLGIVSLSPAEVLTALFRIEPVDAQTNAVVWSIRLPRILVAAIVGAALATVGAVMQAVLRNPLAEPGITGVSAGAAVGAVSGITFGAFGGELWGDTASGIHWGGERGTAVACRATHAAGHYARCHHSRGSVNQRSRWSNH